ncbi:GNAT family N-acetyltransferase [Streptosporangium longisporum]|uniref:BioF2-like acetyltransferase domain-containing protein n=1 Tax=Streptosporangium longisporum TaxID=46187 RepID=A0ABN3Y3R4_9ACTN
MSVEGSTTTLTNPRVPGEPAGRYRVELARGVAAVDRDAWNDVVNRCAGAIFYAWEWLAAFEESPPGVFEPAHLLAYDGEDLVGVCPAYLVHHCPRLEYALTLGAPIDLRRDGPVLLAHSLAALRGGPLALPGHRSAAHALVTGLERAAGALGAWAWGIANAPAGDLAGRLLGQGYAAAHLTTAYRLDTVATTPERYWDGLPGRRRRRLRREQRQGAEGLVIGESRPDATTMVRLAHAVLREHDTPVDVLPEPYLRSLARHLRPYERTITAADERGEVVAMFGGWQFGGEWALWIAGLQTGRYSVFEPYHAMIAHSVEAAITTDTRVLDLGRGNGVVKRRYGATGTPLFLALKAADRGRDALLHAWCRQVQARSQTSAHGLGVASRRCC